MSVQNIQAGERLLDKRLCYTPWQSLVLKAAIDEIRDARPKHFEHKAIMISVWALDCEMIPHSRQVTRIGRLGRDQGQLLQNFDLITFASICGAYLDSHKSLRPSSH